LSYCFFFVTNILHFLIYWKVKWNKLNAAVGEINNKARGSKICPITQKKFFLGMGIMIAAAGHNCRGCKLWATDSQDVPVMADPKT
jgi:hypothetical protein